MAESNSASSRPRGALAARDRGFPRLICFDRARTPSRTLSGSGRVSIVAVCFRFKQALTVCGPTRDARSSTAPVCTAANAAMPVLRVPASRSASLVAACLSAARRCNRIVTSFTERPAGRRLRYRGGRLIRTPPLHGLPAIAAVRGTGATGRRWTPKFRLTWDAKCRRYRI